MTELTMMPFARRRQQAGRGCDDGFSPRCTAATPGLHRCCDRFSIIISIHSVDFTLLHFLTSLFRRSYGDAFEYGRVIWYSCITHGISYYTWYYS